MIFNGKNVITKDDFDYSKAKPGDYEEEAIVVHAMNCLTPVSMTMMCAQMGEPYSMKIDEKTGCLRNTYGTFKNVINGVWEFCGFCFKGENVERGNANPYMEL